MSTTGNVLLAIRSRRARWRVLINTRGKDLGNNYSRTFAVPSTNTTSGQTIHDERGAGADTNKLLGAVRPAPQHHWLAQLASYRHALWCIRQLANRLSLTADITAAERQYLLLRLRRQLGDRRSGHAGVGALEVLQMPEQTRQGRPSSSAGWRSAMQRARRLRGWISETWSRGCRGGSRCSSGTCDRRGPTDPDCRRSGR